MNTGFQFFYSSTYDEHSDNWPAYGLKFTRENDEKPIQARFILCTLEAILNKGRM
jgi:hypothetical protein